MKNLEIKKKFWDKFPKAQIEVLIIRGIDNHIKDSTLQERLDKASNAAIKYVSNDVFTENTIIKDWRSAFSIIKTKKGARSSIEALLKRVSKGQQINSINPLVDLYNCISLEYGVPCGGEDVLELKGGLFLGEARGGEKFIPLGTEESSPALETEMIYYDEIGAVCRSLNWREAKRTMLTEETTDAIFVLEAIYEHQTENIVTASNALKNSLETYFNTPVEHHSLNSNSEIINF